MERTCRIFWVSSGSGCRIYADIGIAVFSVQSRQSGPDRPQRYQGWEGAWWSPDDAVCCNSRQRVSMCMLPGISGGLLSRSPKIDPSARVETANHQSRDIRPHRVRKRVLDGTGPPSDAPPISMICRKSKIRFGIAGSLVMVRYQILQPEFPYILFNNRRLKAISRIHFKNRQ